MTGPAFCTIIDLGTDADAGEWLAALPFVHFDVSDYVGHEGANRPRFAAPVDPLSHASTNTPGGQQHHAL